MSWDDEDFEVPTASNAAVLWENEDDEPLMDSWDVDEEAEAAKKKAEDDKRKAELKRRQEEAKAKKAKAKAGPGLLDIDTVDETTRREMLRQAELSADLNNAADLFGGLGVALDKLDDVLAHPRERAAAAAVKKPAAVAWNEQPLFQPTNKAEFERLRKAIAPVLTGLAEDQLLHYASGLAIDLIRDLVQPLSVENLRKVVSTLNVVQKEKERQERQARLQKSGGTATGGAGKKKAKPLVKTNVNNSFKKDAMDEMEYDDFDEDDFM